MTDTQKSDKILEILNAAVQYSSGGTMAIGAIAVMIQTGVNIIADAIGARRVTLEEVIDALVTQTNATDDTIEANRAKLKAMLIG